ncbi:MAG TPA: hypothetical protein VD948_10210, partial [Rhodothermales bacterium]|nr:hypothetical protein [Rhodothermales bacterium]
DLVDRLVRRGYDLSEFALGLQEHLRNLLVARTMPDTRLIEAAPAVQARYGDVAAAMTEVDLLRQLTLVAEAETAMKASSQPRMRLELALARLAAMASAHDLNVALRAVERLEALAREGKLERSEVRGAKPETAAPAAQPPRGPVATTPPAYPGPAFPSPPVSRVAEPSPKQDLATVASETRPTPASPPPAAAPTRSPDPSVSDPAGLFSAPALRPRRPAPDAGPAAVAVLRTPDVEVVPQAGLGAVAAAWQALPGALSGPRLAAVVREAVPLAVEGATLVLGVPSDLHGQMLGEAADTLLEALRPRVGDGLRYVRCVVREPEATPMDAADPQTLAQELRRTSEVARTIFDTFGGEVVY